MMEDKKWLNLLTKSLSTLNDRPSWNTYFMSIAILLSTRSSCQRLHVGCVLVSGNENPNRIIAAGYNGFLPGLPHRSIIKEGHEQATVHAEQNALADAARRGVTTQNAIAYITHFPCINCAKILLAAGIKHCYYHEDYHNDPLVHEIFQEANVKLEQF